MKKILLALSLVASLTACGNLDPVVDVSPADGTSEKVMAPQPFYITDLSLNTDGTYRLAQQPVTWLSESEGSCRNMSSSVIEDPSIPSCNPNGFLLVESDFVSITEDFPASVPVYGINFAAVADYIDVQEDGALSMADLLDSFQREPDFFKVTPFELEYGTVTVDGVEMTDQITALKEIYIP